MSKKTEQPNVVIPDGTPAGAKFIYTAVGLTMVVVFGACAYLYAVIRPEITQYMDMKKQEVQLQHELVNGESIRKYDALSTLLSTHTNQLENLSGQLGEVRSEKKSLEYKVAELERRVFQLEGDLDDCEVKLSACLGE